MHRHQFFCPLVHLSEFQPFVHFKNRPRYKLRVCYKFHRADVYSFNEISATFSCSSEIFFSHVFCLICLLHEIRFQFSHLVVNFLLSKRFDVFTIWKFYSFLSLSFSNFHGLHNKFFNAKFHHNILTQHSYCLYQGHHFFFWQGVSCYHPFT